MNIVATLMAGVVGTETYVLDESGQVFLVDDKKQRHSVAEPIAAKVRDAIKRGASASERAVKQALLGWHKGNCKNCVELAPEQWDLCGEAQELLAGS